MAKKTPEKAPLSWNDFTEDSLLDSAASQEEENEEEQEEQEEEQEEEKEEKKSKKSKVKAKDEEEESEEEEEEKEKPKKDKSSKVKAPKDEEENEEEEEESEEEESEESEEENEEDEEDPSEFYKEVEKLTGQEVEVDYGDVAPNSPQGVALREKAVGETAVDNFLGYLEENHPAAFKALNHSYNGGDIADLYKVANTRDYTKVELKDDDKDLAKELIKEYYQSKGVKNPGKITRILELAEDSEEGIVAEAKGILTELKEDQVKKEQEVLKAAETSKKEQQRKDQVLVSAVDEVLESGKLDSFKLGGKAEASEFRQFVLRNIRKAKDGGYEVATQLDPNNLEKILQYQFFQFKKGDLSKLISIKATTENTKKLKFRMGEEKSKLKKTAAEDKEKGKTLSLSSFDAE